MNHAKTKNRDDSARAIPFFKRRRCQNCNKLYQPTREDQKFCRELPDKDKCRKEFYRYGSSYGPLKTGLHKAIDKKYAELARLMKAERLQWKKDGAEVLTELTLELHEDRETVKRLAVEVAQLRAQMDTDRGQFENHTHDVYPITKPEPPSR